MDSEENDLATALRLGTQALHLEAERSGYVQEILKRRASQTGYTLLLRNLLPAYHAMEAALIRHRDHAAHHAFDWPPLFRSAALEADLQALAGPGFAETVALLPAGQNYAERIENIGTMDPPRLIGHAYVRYIGDLSGGQIVKRLLSEAPGLNADMLGFYDFPAIADADIYKDGFRDALTRTGEKLGDIDGIVEEARQAFRQNIDLSTAVLDHTRVT